MAVNYQALKKEIALPAYVGLSDDEIVAALNAQITGPAIAIPLGTLAGVIEMTGIYERLEATTASLTASDALKAVCRKVLRLVSGVSPIAELDMADPASAAAVGSILDALVAGSVITADERVAILALGETTTTRARQVFGAPVSVDDLVAARAA